jgi:hypothetical protein
MDHPVFLELLYTTIGGINVVLALHGQAWSLCTCVELVLHLSYNGRSSISLTQYPVAIAASNERSNEFHCLETHEFCVPS